MHKIRGKLANFFVRLGIFVYCGDWRSNPIIWQVDEENDGSPIEVVRGGDE